MCCIVCYPCRVSAEKSKIRIKSEILNIYEYINPPLIYTLDTNAYDREYCIFISHIKCLWIATSCGFSWDGIHQIPKEIWGFDSYQDSDPIKFSSRTYDTEL